MQLPEAQTHAWIGPECAPMVEVQWMQSAANSSPGGWGSRKRYPDVDAHSSLASKRTPEERSDQYHLSKVGPGQAAQVAKGRTRRTAQILRPIQHRPRDGIERIQRRGLAGGRASIKDVIVSIHGPFSERHSDSYSGPGPVGPHTPKPAQ